jgi:hypothetical protein
VTRRISIIRIGVLILAGSVASCTKTLSVSDLQKTISEGLTAQMGLKIASVSCPGDRPFKANDVFDCSATPEGGGKLTIKVTQKDAAGNINWELANAEGLLSVEKLQVQIKEGLMTQAKIDATVSCGAGKFRVSKPGDVFDCLATDPAGKTATVTVTIKDTDGNVNWKLK